MWLIEDGRIMLRERLGMIVPYEESVSPGQIAAYQAVFGQGFN